MALQAGTCELKPYGVVELYADLLENISGVRPDMLAPGSKGKNLNGARLFLSAVGGKPERVCDVLEKVIELKGAIPNMMVVVGATVEAMYALDLENTTDRAAFERVPAVQRSFDEWEL